MAEQQHGESDHQGRHQEGLEVFEEAVAGRGGGLGSQGRVGAGVRGVV